MRFLTNVIASVLMVLAWSVPAVADAIQVSGSVSTITRVHNEPYPAPDTISSCSTANSAQGNVDISLGLSCTDGHGGRVQAGTTNAATVNAAFYHGGHDYSAAIDPLSGGVFLYLAGFIPCCLDYRSSGSGQVSLSLVDTYVLLGGTGKATLSFEVQQIRPYYVDGPPVGGECAFSIGGTLYSCPPYRGSSLDNVVSFEVEYGKPFDLSFDARLSGDSQFVETAFMAVTYNFVLPEGSQLSEVPEPSTALLLLLGTMCCWKRGRRARANSIKRRST